MKYVICLFAAVGLTACKDEGPAAVAEAKPLPMIQTQGCKVAKSHGTITVSCADGSSVDFAEPTNESPTIPTMHVKDSSGSEYKNLLYFTGNGATLMAMNSASGHILGYDSAGSLTTVTVTLFESGNCTGQAYALPSGGVIVKNRVMVNNQAWPVPSSGLIITGFQSGSVTFNSKFTGNRCLAATSSSTQASMVEAVDLDVTDLTSIGLPVELVYSN